MTDKPTHSPQDIRLVAMDKAVTLHTQSLRHLFTKSDDADQAAWATGEVLATAERFAAWIEHGNPEAPALESGEAGKREGMARALEHLAGVIRDRNVAPTMYSIDVGVSTATIAELETWAAALGAKVTSGGTCKTIPVVRADDFVSFGNVRLDVRAQAHEHFPAEQEGGEGDA